MILRFSMRSCPSEPDTNIGRSTMRLGPMMATSGRLITGVVATPLWTKLDRELDEIGEGQNGFDSMASGIILGRAADPEDIVPTGIFLAAPDSDYITGQIIPIEGGMILV